MDRLLDLRSQQSAFNTVEACKIDLKTHQPLKRTPTGVTLHQTACWYSVAPYQLEAAKGDEVLARHRRALGVHAHITAMRHGKFVVAYDPDVYVNHGDLLNSEDVGLEHEGLYDYDGKPIDLPRGVDVGEIIEAGRAALEWLVSNVPTLRYVHAHRQSRRAPKRAKQNDPGRRIFQEVGIEWGVKKLGLSIEPDRVLGSGLALPRSWYVQP